MQVDNQHPRQDEITVKERLNCVVRTLGKERFILTGGKGSESSSRMAFELDFKGWKIFQKMTAGLGGRYY